MLGLKHNVSGFEQYRRWAERDARKAAYEKTGSTEIDIYDIYRELNKYIGLDIDKAVQMEFDTEMDMVYANPYAKRVFDLLTANGKRVIALSDMYLPGEMIGKLLDKCGYRGFEDILVSCEHGCSKRNQGLYAIASDRFGKSLKYAHIGDNPVSDVKSAQESGWKPFLYKNVNEAGMFYRAQGMSKITGSAYAGIVNAHLHSGIKKYSVPYEYGFVYGGILVLGYCRFIHNYVQKNGIEKILFLSRDGNILKKVYDNLYPGNQSEYVYWSRIAAARIAVKKYPHEFLLRFIKYNAFQSPKMRDVFESMGLPGLCRYFSGYGLEEDTILDKENGPSAMRLVRDHWAEVFEVFAPENEAARLYFGSVLEGCKSACAVDIGWAASGPMTLKYLIEDEWNLGCGITGMVAGTKSVVDFNILEPQLVSGGIVSYMFSQRHNHHLYGMHNIGKRHSIFSEMLLSAPSPSFAGFKLEDDGDFSLKFDLPEVEGYETMNEIQQGILDFSEVYTGRFRDYPYMLNISGSDAYLAVRQIITCTQYYLKFFSDYPYNKGVASNGLKMDALRVLLNN